MLEGFSFPARIIKKNNYCSSLFLIPDVAFLGLKHVELCSLSFSVDMPMEKCHWTQ